MTVRLTPDITSGSVLRAAGPSDRGGRQLPGKDVASLQAGTLARLSLRARPAARGDGLDTLCAQV
jgi:hypothetical protein